MTPVELFRLEAARRGITFRPPEKRQARVRRARRSCFRCEREVMSTTAVERPVCHGCRRELMGLPRERPSNRRAYWRAYDKRRRAGRGE